MEKLEEKCAWQKVSESQMNIDFDLRAFKQF